MPDESKIEGTVNAIKGLVEAVPVYQDTVQPAAKQVGEALETVAKSIHVLLAPVSALVWGYDKIRDYVSTRVAEKLKHVPEKDLRTPDPSVAGPVLEALRYTGHKTELREMYASLLASAMDAATMENAHPAFVEIIRQLSSDEAKILEALAIFTTGYRVHPVIDVRYKPDIKNSGWTWVVEGFWLIPYDTSCANPKLGPSYLVNLQRLGLVHLKRGVKLISGGDTDEYKALLEHSDLSWPLKYVNSLAGQKVEIEKHSVGLSPLGKQFCTACFDKNTSTAQST